MLVPCLLMASYHATLLNSAFKSHMNISTWLNWSHLARLPMKDSGFFFFFFFWVQPPWWRSTKGKGFRKGAKWANLQKLTKHLSKNHSLRVSYISNTVLGIYLKSSQYKNFCLKKKLLNYMFKFYKLNIIIFTAILNAFTFLTHSLI